MKILITGGAGFIGVNLADYFLSKKNTVTILDNFSRRGTDFNSQFLINKYPKTSIVKADVRNYHSVFNHVRRNEIIFHLAGQVAVTTSIKNPRDDFESNILGTLNVLEAARKAKHKPVIFYASTNKVYGKIQGKIIKKEKRYIDTLHKNGIDEKENLDFYSPYGCSKGAADQYVHDYWRIYQIPTVIFRQSCIYGMHQLGLEDQGWVAHFAIKAIRNKPITIFGSGLQVRDILSIDDLIKVYEKSLSKIASIQGEIFNIGGGKKNTVSLLELIKELENLLNKKISVNFKEKRPGDQDVYISNIKKADKILNWRPEVTTKQGLLQLTRWVDNNISAIKKFA